MLTHVSGFVIALTTCFNRLPGLTEVEFEKQKAALQSTKLQRDRSLHDETMRHWDHVCQQR